MSALVPEPASVAVGALLLATGYAVVPFGAALLQRVQPRRQVFFARWGFGQLIGAALAGLLVFLLLGPLVGEGGLGSVLRSDGYLVGALGVAVLAARRAQPEGWRALGLASPRVDRALPFALVTWAFSLPVVWGAALAWPAVVGWLGGSPTADLLPTAVDGLDGTSRWIALASLGLLAPVLREALFRGFFQPLLVQNFSERGGLFLSALAFALLHPPALFLPALLLGGAAAVAQLRTGSLLASAGVHVLHQVTVLTVLSLAGPEALPLPLF